MARKQPEHWRATESDQMTELPKVLNGNSLAVWVTKNEAGAEQISIAQVKRVIRVLSWAMFERPTAMIRLLLRLGEGK